MTRPETAGLVLWVLAATAIEAVAAHYPGVPSGFGIALCAAGLAGAWLESRARPRLRALSWSMASGWEAEISGQSRVPLRFGAATRRLARSVLVDCRTGSDRRRLWLLPGDVEPAALRRLAMLLACQRGGQAQ